MRNRMLSIFNVLAFALCATALAVGVAEPTVLPVCVDWIKGWTDHADLAGGVAVLANAPPAITPELRERAKTLLAALKGVAAEDAAPPAPAPAPAPAPVVPAPQAQADDERTAVIAAAAAQAAVEVALKGLGIAPNAGVTVKGQHEVGAPAIDPNGRTRQPDTVMKAFERYLRFGDEGARKAWLSGLPAGAIKADVDMQEGTGAEGGFLVPTDHHNNIITKRNEASIPRRAGAMVVTGSTKDKQVPTDAAGDGEFTLTAEEAANTRDTPAVGQVTLTAYRFTKRVPVSVELLADEQSNLMAYLERYSGRGMAATENKYTLTGTGTGQPQGILVGGTAAVTFVSATTIAASEIPKLYGKLAQEYRDRAVWAMNGETEALLRGLQGEVFLFQNTPAAQEGPDAWDRLMNKPVFNSKKIDTIATAKKTVAIGNWEYYGLYDREGLFVLRDPFSKANNGQVVFHYAFRFGGAVLQAEAFQYGTQA